MMVLAMHIVLCAERRSEALPNGNGEQWVGRTFWSSEVNAASMSGGGSFSASSKNVSDFKTCNRLHLVSRILPGEPAEDGAEAELSACCVEVDEVAFRAAGGDRAQFLALAATA